MKKYIVPITMAILLIVIVIVILLIKSKKTNGEYSVTVESFSRTTSNSQVAINPEG